MLVEKGWHACIQQKPAPSWNSIACLEAVSGNRCNFVQFIEDRPPASLAIASVQIAISPCDA